jgi:2,3-bisphosphoglycerate-dependent phosphoglycerate mutase
MNDKVTTFYLVRHGETDWNKKRLVQGQLDIPLNETGEEQAKSLADVLEHVQFDLAFSSDLLRAKRTAEIVVLEKALLVATTQLLRDRNFGKFQGGTVDALRAYFSLLEGLTHEERYKHRMADDVESDEEVTTRLMTFLRETALTHPGKTILVGTHGILRMVLIHLGFLTYEQSDETSVKNGAYIKLTSDGVDFFVKETVGLVPINNLADSI